MLFKESTSGEFTISLSRTSFEGLPEAEQTADCCVLDVNALIVVALVVVTFAVVNGSFSEQRVLFDRHVPILTIFFLRVKLEVIGAELSPTKATLCAGTFI